MARAKNTSRAEARRRTRGAQRADLIGGELAYDAADLSDAEEIQEEPQQRRPLFRMPDVRADLRAMPATLMSRRLLWLPLLLLLGGFAAILVAPGMAPEVQSILLLYVQFFFIPPALFTFFIAGFVAPRASYLFGLAYGLIAGVLWSVALLVSNTNIATGEPSATPTTDGPIAVLSQMLVIGALYGMLAAAFASWYRDFLRQMQQRGNQRRADQESKRRARQREERQESRRSAKRPS